MASLPFGGEAGGMVERRGLENGFTSALAFVGNMAYLLIRQAQEDGGHVMGIGSHEVVSADNWRAFLPAAAGWLVASVLMLPSAPALAQGATVPGEAEEASAEAPPSTEAPEAEAPEAERSAEGVEPPVERRGPRTANSLQLGIGFRYGVELDDAEPNPWGTGLGLDVGFTLPNAIYVGGAFEYFFGSSTEIVGTTLSSNVWQLSAEGGYDVGLGEHFVIRPKVGVGIAGSMVRVEGCPAGVTCEDSSDVHPLIAPGATFMLFMSGFSLSIDTRYALVLADTTGKALIFSVGVGF